MAGEIENEENYDEGFDQLNTMLSELPLGGDLQTFAAPPQMTLADAKWPSSHQNAPDTWHLPAVAAGASFDLTADLVRKLIEVGDYDPDTTTNGKLIVSLRGCALASDADSTEDQDKIGLRVATPDHENFNCLIGVFDTATGRISLYLASTVPRRTGMLKFYNKMNFNKPARNCNMLPTGCYELCVGTHGGSSGPVPYVLRLGNGPTSASAGFATVIRTTNDLTYGTQDKWDNTRPADNIHPAFLSASFSSLGCLTVKGWQSQNNDFSTGSGEWRMFRKKAGFDGALHGKRFDNLLVTGHEAAVVAQWMAAGKDLNELKCLRHGSKGARVQALQNKLSLSPDGDLGADTVEALYKLQKSKLGFATGSWSPAMAVKLGMPFA